MISSTKALTGHGLSMAGALEVAVAPASGGIIPGCAHLEIPDPACDGLDLPLKTLRQAPRLVLNNSSGFGGSNVCIVLENAGE